MDDRKEAERLVKIYNRKTIESAIGVICFISGLIGIIVCSIGCFIGNSIGWPIANIIFIVLFFSGIYFLFLGDTKEVEKEINDLCDRSEWFQNEAHRQEDAENGMIW